MAVWQTFVAECLKANQYALACLRKEMRRQLPRPVPINAVWAMDLTFYTDATGRQQLALGGHPRSRLAAAALFAHAGEQAQLDVVGPPLPAIGRHGKPGRIRTDNEVIFTSFVFTSFLKLVGIRNQRIQTCAPWQNGRIERLFGTLKPLLRQLVIPSRAALQTACHSQRQRALLHLAGVHCHVALFRHSAPTD
ncbi:hypothetical protein [Rhodoferax sp.]|uniref:hypothetical protein n=1 Tax=Rhodoferax sp. TaxID=50421 RepID=UPI00274EA327|nr:hypothetical protein [Rhodoferax sp.]